MGDFIFPEIPWRTRGIVFRISDPRGMEKCHFLIPWIPEEWKSPGNWHPWVNWVSNWQEWVLLTKNNLYRKIMENIANKNCSCCHGRWKLLERCSWEGFLFMSKLKWNVVNLRFSLAFDWVLPKLWNQVTSSSLTLEKIKIGCDVGKLRFVTIDSC